ncbi:MAG: DUF3604 domain-containing protein, partial [Proteobacteria bacterium]|nr:DUF3604 domain-containing protein [Pseudomonadota bacterium]
MFDRSRCTLLAFALLAGCSESGPPESAETPAETSEPAAAAVSCLDRSPLRNAYFGELHVHTGLSMDAYAFGVRATPDDAYRFARGEPIEFTASRQVRLERSLDFAAVTDHASYMGEMSLCMRADSPVYDSRRCRAYRREEEPEEGTLPMYAQLGALMPGWVSTAARSPELCGEDFELCRSEMQTVWEASQAATERADDPCRFTAFHGYEYTATPDLTKIHHNVVFRNANVPLRPVAWVDEPSAWGLWEKLAEHCLDAGIDCDVLTIPHNSNMSSGRMFALDYMSLPLERQVELARLRARLEPLVEIMQTKGDSECRNDMWKVLGGRDEQCDFEKIRALAPAPEDCRDGVSYGGLVRQGCLSRLDFVRYALVEGLREAERIGVNPLKLGITASTDA